MLMLHRFDGGFDDTVQIGLAAGRWEPFADNSNALYYSNKVPGQHLAILIRRNFSGLLAAL